MKIEFNKEDLDYLAEKIAELISGNKQMKASIDVGKRTIKV